jgi:acetoin utilization protein AcuB
MKRGHRLETIRVRDCMTREPAVVCTDVPVRGAAEMLKARTIRHLLVVDPDGRLVGIVTDRDLRQLVFRPSIAAWLGDRAEALAALTVGEVMSGPVVTIAPGAEVREAARLMHERKIGALPVVEDDRLVGILTEHDVLGAFERALGRTG